MCGITGILSQAAEPVAPVVLKRMMDAIAHRGPDGEGSFVDAGIGLGHRRLAIIDLTASGHQPMSTEDGRFVLSYNGEVYNFQELRIQLEALGYQFHSRTDSEVVLKALAEWGVDALSRFNGMFAFALWDRRAQRLMLARDRYGIKPLYYAWCGSTFLFGSEIKAILAYPQFRVSMDREGLVEYLTFQNFFTDRTLFNGVRLFPAGHYMWITQSPGSAEPRSYWDFSFGEPPANRSDAQYVEELDYLLRQAVSRQLVSDVDVGAYLSGGMDSGAVTALAARELPFMRSFTVGFDLSSASGIELSFDERAAAERLSYLFRTEHYEMVLKAGDMERVMPNVCRHLEEPRVGQSYPNYYASYLASRFVKVVLSGTGGDELFAGYPWRYYRAMGSLNFDDYIASYYAYWQRLLPNGWLKRVLEPIWGEVSRVDPMEIFRSVFRNGVETIRSPEDCINNSLYLEAKTFLHGLLIVEDKLSMAHSLETRVPFLDNDLVDFAMKIPTRLRLAHLGRSRRINENEPGNKSDKYVELTSDGKLLLREVMKRHIPESITQARKQGFSAPDASWFKGESIDFVRRRLLDGRPRIFEYMDRSAVHELINDHLQGRENRRLLIWALLSLEEWSSQFGA